jgi:FixH protein
MAKIMKDLAVPQLFMGCVLVAFFCGMFATFIYAARHVSSVTDRDYYLHGLDYSKNSRHDANGVVLGWQMTTSVQNDHLEVSVTDAKGQFVRGGKAYFAAQMPDGRAAATIPFSEPEPGVYRVALKPLARGLSGHITFAAGAASMTRRVVINP